jgi:hypothetical protein
MFNFLQNHDANTHRPDCRSGVTPRRFRWVASETMVLAFVAFSCSGCIAIRNGATTTTPMMTSVACDTACAPNALNEVCPLYDRKEVAKQWASRLNPMRLVPGRVTEWVACQHAHCVSCRHGLCHWYQRKREDANAPPWPHFHPVPTKPAFEPETPYSDVDATPEAYGTFGRD